MAFCFSRIENEHFFMPILNRPLSKTFSGISLDRRSSIKAFAGRQPVIHILLISFAEANVLLLISSSQFKVLTLEVINKLYISAVSHPGGTKQGKGESSGTFASNPLEDLSWRGLIKRVFLQLQHNNCSCDQRKSLLRML